MLVYVAINRSCCGEDWWYTRRLLQVASYRGCRVKVLLGQQRWIQCFAVGPWNPWAPLLLCRLFMAKMLKLRQPPRPIAPNLPPPRIRMVPTGSSQSAFYLACHQFIIVAHASFLMLHLLVHVEAEALLYAEQEGAIEMLGGGYGNVQGCPGPNLVLQLSGSCSHMRT